MTDGFPASDTVAVETSVSCEQGRWVVWLDVVQVPDHDPHVVRHRLGDYGTRAEAEVAARWMARAANRDLSSPPSGF